MLINFPGQLRDILIFFQYYPATFNLLLPGASIGIALFHGDGDGPDQLVKAADTVMYQVKNADKNSFAFAGGLQYRAIAICPPNQGQR